ncbi:MAG: hypothetical protein JSR58_04240 [Verrucomicrobia bacterium]|nr:hypothetical protein [Verrucomicrobiota bacterium]
MDHSIRKKWLIAFWASYGMSIITAFVTLNVVAFLSSIIFMGIIYYCAYKKYGTWLLSFQLICTYITIGIIGIMSVGLISAFFFGTAQQSATLASFKRVLSSPIDIIQIAISGYYIVCSYRLRAFNRLYRQKLFADQSTPV